jgi:hypothetical protein
MFVEMRLNEILWPARRNKKPVRERQMSVRLGVDHGLEARGAVVMLWAGVVSVE